MELTGPRVSVSVCMMVKNEEENLQRSLPSITELADELIVVDTGSTDKSVEICEQYNAKMYHHPWDNDFSKHRNQSISYATSDWIFIFDADEELLIKDSIDQLKIWLGQLEDDCSSSAVVLHDIQKSKQAMKFNSVRFFRKGAVEYRGTVHNHPVILKGEAKAVICPYVKLNHYGYDLPKEKALLKRERTEGLLLKRIEDDPDDVAAYFYLAQLYTAHNEYDEAIKYINRYEQTVNKSDVEFNGSIFCTAFSVFRKVNDKKNTEKWLLKGLKKFPKDLDLLMNLTEYGVWQKKLNLVIDGAKGFLEAYREFSDTPLAGGNRFIYAAIPEAKAYCLFHLSLALFQQSDGYLNMLDETLKVADKQYSSGMRNDLRTIFTRFGWDNKKWNPKVIGSDVSNVVQPQFKKVVNLSR
jgi:glycosyltransferase involved in cell wall biosynthesis